jgi:ribosomal protein L5
MSNYAADVPLINVPFVTPDGRVSEAWFMFLIQLFRRTGGSGGSALEDLAIDVATMADDPVISALFDALDNTNVQLQTEAQDAPSKASKADLIAQSVTLALVLQEAQDVLTRLRRALQDSLIDQMTPLDPIRSMAYQDASNVKIRGGSIDGTPIGATTASTGKFTNLALTSVTPTVAAGQLGLGATTATTVGGAGGASALPATPAGYLVINVGGSNFKIPYYNP